MVLVIPQEEVIDVNSRLQQLQLASFTIGEIVKRKNGEKNIIVG
jgi:phosphoribosylaminoimidazole (AIR) synthetase